MPVAVTTEGRLCLSEPELQFSTFSQDLRPGLPGFSLQNRENDDDEQDDTENR